MEVGPGTSWSGRLVVFVDYEQADTGRNEYVVLRVDDLFLQFNRAKSFNAATGEHRDKVVLVSGDATESVASVLLGGLEENQLFSRNGVTFEVCSLVMEVVGGPDYADVQICPTGDQSTCPMQPLETSAPTPYLTQPASPDPTPPFRLQQPTAELTLGLDSPRTVLIVRVLGDSGAEQPAESRNLLAGAVFGLGSEAFPNSMRAQYNRCSFGKLDLRPATGFSQISNGVMDVRLGYSLQGRLIYSIRTDVRAEAANLLGVGTLDETFDHVMFCVAPGTNAGTTGGTSRSWTAFATRPGSESYIASGTCDKLSELMHQIAHNLDLIHSADQDGENGDTSGSVRLDALLHVISDAHLTSVVDFLAACRWEPGKTINGAL